jgi:hypothetical protein
MALKPKQKKWLAIYLCLIVFNCLCIYFGEPDSFNLDLWPFNVGSRGYNYDWFDFLVYTIGPVVFYFIVKLFKESRE